MSLVPSLLQAIVRVDGEALVMHVGEKPYVVSPNGQVDLATRGLTFDAVNGLVAQLLSPEALKSLEDVGATQFELPAFDEFPGEHFTVTAARGGDDLWAEIRRRPAQDDDLAAPDLFEGFVAPPPSEPEPAPEDLVQPQERQPWPTAEPAPMAAPDPEVEDDPRIVVADCHTAPSPAEAAAAEERVAPNELPGGETVQSAPAGPPALDVEAPVATGMADGPADEPNESQKAIVSWLAAFSSSHRLRRSEMSRTPDVFLPAPEPIEPLVVAAPAATSSEATETVDVIETPDIPAPPAPVVVQSPDDPIDTPAEPAMSAIEPEPVSAPALVNPSAPTSVEARSAGQASEPVMSTQPTDLRPLETLPLPHAVATHAPEPLGGRPPSPMPAAEPPLPARSAFVPFPSLDQPRPAVVVPIARGGQETVASEPVAASLERLVRLAASRGATALYLSSGARPSVRLDGDVQALDGSDVLGAAEIESLLVGAAPDLAADIARGSCEWVWELGEVGSVRCTSFRDHRGPGGVFRILPIRALSASQLGLSREIQSLVGETEGLVLISGPRASGKSTLISSLVDLINRTRRDFVISIEREVTVVHERQGAFISQREVRGGSDEAAAAARAALREDPDVLVIDDLRTSALMTIALDAASNGQLVLGGVPAHHASGAIERLIDLYQPEQRRQVQLSLAQQLRGVVSQVLLRKSGGGRVAAREVLLNTPIVSSLLAEGRTAQLPVAIDGGRKNGMVPLNDALVGFVQSGAVDVREAYRRAADKGGLLELLKRQGIDTSFVERLA